MVEPGSNVCWTEVSVVFGAVLLGVDSEFVAEGGFVAEGKAVWEDLEGGADDEKPFSGKEAVDDNNWLVRAVDVTTVGKTTGEDAAIDENEEILDLTAEDEAVAKLTTEVELRMDEDRVVPKLTTEVEFKMDVELSLLRSEDNGVDTDVESLTNKISQRALLSPLERGQGR
jgi:hypothetical protein